jgi:hypothetical protein
MISFKAENPYSTESTRMVHGIMFILPSRQRFIPYSWLVYSEVNEKETELQFHYTHTVVTVTGTNLRFIHEAVIRYELLALRELTPPASARENGSTVSRIEITEKVAEG